MKIKKPLTTEQMRAIDAQKNNLLRTQTFKKIGASRNAVNQYVEKMGYKWKKKLDVLPESIKRFVEQHINLKPKEIVAKLAKDKGIIHDYDPIYNYYHSFKRKLSNEIIYEDIRKPSGPNFKINIFKNEFQFVVGPKYPYPQNIQFIS